MRGEKQPGAFLSYVHDDDRYGDVTTFRKRLAEEVSAHLGDEFLIFQDHDIAWGQQWRARIEESLDNATFLIPIITPRFFASDHCRDELRHFLEREAALGRTDLVLPVYYIEYAPLNDPSRRGTDDLLGVIASHQYADWRDLRGEPFTSPEVRRRLARMARQVVAALEHGQPASVPRTPTAPRGATPGAGGAVPSTTGVSEAQGSPAGRPTSKTAPPIRVVDQLHRGDHVTISEAIKAARPGDWILVRPGLYQEGLVLDKPLEIVGDGDPGEVVVRANGKDALLFKTTMGRVANLTLRQVGGGEWYGVDIAQGRLELEDCDISSQSLACVAIHDWADPRLRRDRIHDGKSAGVFVYDNGQGLLEDNDISANANAGVAIKTGGTPTLRHNRIHDGEAGGVLVHDNGQGLLEDNDIFANANAGVTIKTGGTPTLRHNRINRNGYEAVWVYEGGGGIVEDNDLRDNQRGAWDVAADSAPKVTRARNQE